MTESVHEWSFLRNESDADVGKLDTNQGGFVGLTFKDVAGTVHKLAIPPKLAFPIAKAMAMVALQLTRPDELATPYETPKKGGMAN